MADVELDTGELERAMGGLSRELARDAADVWFSTSQDILAEADSEEADSDLFPIMRSASPPAWDAARGAYTFSYSHLATIFHEYGAEPHVIRARRAEYLAFEWPDAPAWVREQFEETFPLVFFKEVNHPGVPERRFVRGGRDRAVRWLQEEAGREAFGGVFS